MANLRFTGSLSPIRIADLGILLLVLAGVSATIWYSNRNEEGPAVQRRPPAQIGQDDYGGPVWSVAFSPDATALASAALTGEVWMKDLATGRLSRILVGNLGVARFLAYSPDGRVLAVVGGGEPAVRLWDVETRTELDPLPIGGEATRSITFAPDGAVLAVGQKGNGSGHACITLWDYGNRRQLAVLQGHRGGVNTLEFSRDGALLASGDSTGLVKLWDVRARRERVTLPARQQSITAVAFSPDGTTLATANAIGFSVQLWDVSSGAPRGELPTASGVFAVSFSPDGKMLVVADSYGTATLWDVGSVRKLGIVRTGGRSFWSLAISGDGKRFATGGADGTVRLWDMAQALNSLSLNGP